MRIDVKFHVYLMVSFCLLTLSLIASVPVHGFSIIFMRKFASANRVGKVSRRNRFLLLMYNPAVYSKIVVLRGLWPL